MSDSKVNGSGIKEITISVHATCGNDYHYAQTMVEIDENDRQLKFGTRDIDIASYAEQGEKIPYVKLISMADQIQEDFDFSVDDHLLIMMGISHAHHELISVLANWDAEEIADGVLESIHQVRDAQHV